MKYLIVLLFSFIFSESLTCMSQSHRLYMIPGQGADERLFDSLEINGFEKIVLKYPIPNRKETLPQYAKRMTSQIDTNNSYSILGVSMGGMLAIEMSKFLNPQKIILISSIKSEAEMPFRYKLMRFLPFYKFFGGKFLKRMANFARPIFEPESKELNTTFKSMIDDKNPHFMKRSIGMIVHWKNQNYPSNILHIHGTKDGTLPFKKVNNVVEIKNGSHMIALTRATEVSEIINDFLK